MQNVLESIISVSTIAQAKWGSTVLLEVSVSTIAGDIQDSAQDPI